GIVDDGGATASATDVVTVYDAALTASTGAGLTATEGAPVSPTAATFSAATPGASAADFAGTTIDWGSASPATAATVTLSGGTFSVTGSHIYAEEKGYVATAHIVDDGGATASATDAATVGDAALSATNGAGLTATEGTSTGPVTVATFTDANSFSGAADFAGTSITWGDGSLATAATVTLSGGTFSVTGTHTYAEEGAYTATASIVDDGGATASATDAATVADASLTATPGSAINALVNTSTGTVTVATFTDADSGGTSTDYSAKIDWGDGSPTSSVSPSGSGPFS